MQWSLRHKIKLNTIIRSYTPPDPKDQEAKQRASLESSLTTISWIGIKSFDKPRKVEIQKSNNGYGFCLKMSSVSLRYSFIVLCVLSKALASNH